MSTFEYGLADSFAYAEDATCLADDCENPPLARGLCRKHYQAARKAGELDRYKRLRIKAAVCLVDDCDEPPHGRELCKKHYQRYMSTGTTDLPEKVTLYCSEDDCEEIVVARGLCNMHYMRFMRWGTTEAVGPGVGNPGQPRTSSPTYTSVHARINRWRGTARNFTCVDCGTTARDWSYDGCPDGDERWELVGDREMAFCTHVEHYSPRCKSCHHRKDGIVRNVIAPPAATVALTCAHCGTSFERLDYIDRKRRRRGPDAKPYCSKSCATKARWETYNKEKS